MVGIAYARYIRMNCKDSLQTTRTELVQAVQSELSRFSSPGAIAQPFNMITDHSVAITRKASPLRVKNSEFPLYCSRTIPTRDPCRHSGGLVYAVEWKLYKYRFALGTLQAEHVESIDVGVNEREDASV